MDAPPVLTPERIDAMLSIMAEVCLGSVVEAGQRQKAAPDDEAFERSGRALNQACRNLRQTIALKQRFDREETAKAREAQAAAEADRKAAERDRQARIEFKRKRVRRHLENLVWDEYDEDEAEAFCHDVDQRLSDLVHEDDFPDTPIEALIARLADDIGMNHEPEAETEADPSPREPEASPQEPAPPCGERVGSGGVGSAPEGSHPHPRPLPARGRGEPAPEPVVAQAARPRPPIPRPSPTSHPGKSSDPDSACPAEPAGRSTAAATRGRRRPPVAVMQPLAASFGGTDPVP
ncbi:hypothetical protein [Phenylobacterium sp.]|uniref:hypothetical protein n=1 Tax=Phenylobacterium sp. TaxID=1871053 RepID=UPI003D271B15